MKQWSMVAAGLVFARAVFCVDNVGEPTFFHQLQNSSYYSFGQHAAVVYLEYSKEQHTEIWRLMAKYLLGQCFMWTILGNNFFGRFSKISCQHFEQDAMAISLVQPKERHTEIWCLLVKYLLWQCDMWTTFGKHNYFDQFLNSWCKHFEQDATTLSLEHFKEQHTGIWCLLVKYLLWQCGMWTTKHNYFD